MTVRIAQPNNAVDYADIMTGWNDSQPTISARWPVAAGGPAAIQPWTLDNVHAHVTIPDRTHWLIDNAAGNIGWLAATLTPAGLDNIFVAVRFVTVGTPVQRLVATKRRFRRVLFDGLTAMAQSVPPETPIRAQYPHLVGDTSTTGSVLGFLDEMTARNGVAHVRRGPFREWTLTARNVLDGLTGIVP